MLLFYGPNGNMIQVKMNTGNISATIAQVETRWKKYFPQLPFEYKFLDQDFNSQYAADQKRGKIFAAFSILTIIITCLGLLGLTAFTTQQKQKEISIRRVLGASIAQVVTMITKNYLWLALIAATIAFPVAYYFMNKWFQIFTYNTGLSAIPFIISAFVNCNYRSSNGDVLFSKSSFNQACKNFKDRINYLYDKKLFKSCHS